MPELWGLADCSDRCNLVGLFLFPQFRLELPGVIAGQALSSPRRAQPPWFLAVLLFPWALAVSRQRQWAGAFLPLLAPVPSLKEASLSH